MQTLVRQIYLLSDYMPCEIQGHLYSILNVITQCGTVKNLQQDIIIDVFIGQLRAFEDAFKVPFTIYSKEEPMCYYI